MYNLLQTLSYFLHAPSPGNHFPMLFWSSTFLFLIPYIWDHTVYVFL